MIYDEEINIFAINVTYTQFLYGNTLVHKDYYHELYTNPDRYFWNSVAWSLNQENLGSYFVLKLWRVNQFYIASVHSAVV